ncbi:MAG: PH domain-containing protein [Coriobacteriales bacterium]|nr:PH domain-containing protein [Coriobacteriales bacterium]
MATVSSGIIMDANIMNLKAINLNDVRGEVPALLVPGEQIVSAFQTVRDQVIFTTKRVFVINVQGITGKKTSYFSYPYSKVQYFGIETAGVLDIDSELVLAFSNGAKLQFDFKSNVNIRQISALISGFIL